MLFITLAVIVGNRLETMFFIKVPGVSIYLECVGTKFLWLLILCDRH